MGEVVTQRLPLAAQYIAQLQEHLPADLLARPGSRRFREALRAAAATRSLQLIPSRRELARGVAFLAARGEYLGEIS